MTCAKLVAVPMATILMASSSPLALAEKAGHAGHDHSSHDHAAHGKAAEATAAITDDAMVAAQAPSYPLTTCPVSGEELGSMGDPIDYVHEGRLIRFCCAMCEGEFLKSPASCVAKVDEAVIAAQRPSYALATCPISGMKLGGMGEPYDHVHGTRLVRFCCGGCIPQFEKDSAAAMAKVDAALIEAQRADYPHDKCPVTPDLPLDAMGEPYDILHGTRLVRLCCEPCEVKFRADPAKYLAILDETAAKGK